MSNKYFTWDEMSDKARRDISYAAMCGKEIELWTTMDANTWDKRTPLCEITRAMRVRPKLEKEHVKIVNADGVTIGTGVVSTNHGIPIKSSITMLSVTGEEA